MDGERYKSTILQLFRLTFIVMGPSCIPLDQWLVSIELQQESFPLPGTYYAFGVSRVNFTGNLLIFHIIGGEYSVFQKYPTILKSSLNACSERESSINFHGSHYK